MVIHPTISCLLVRDEKNGAINALSAYLKSIAHVQLTVSAGLPADIGQFDAVVTGCTGLMEDHHQRLTEFAGGGGGWLALVDAREAPLPDALGVRPSAIGPECELRVLFTRADHHLAARLPDAIYVDGVYQYLEKKDDKTEVLLYADWHYRHSAVLSMRAHGAGRVACTTLQAYDHPVLQQILYRVISELSGRRPAREDLGVGLLGYPPWLGRYHGTGIEATSGLRLEAVCDINPARREAAGSAFPQAACHPDADSLAADERVGLVIVSTPPDTHCRLSLQMMAAGKHVVCEKPLALNREQTGQMAEAAERHRVHLSCHQNRRWDVDYLAIRRALDKGWLGDLFYLETFVGGFVHPCGYWHSHAPVSGGLAFDWGGHYLDWIVSLVPDEPRSVIATGHKRVWHDVTNADQERIQIRFAGGQEAEFIHSDIAAATKPKWYLLGTKGAIVGNWQLATALTTDPVLYCREEPIPATEMAPEVILNRRHRGGSVSSQTLVLPQRPHFGFHHNIADHLLTGETLSAPLQDSMTVIAILEAAARSAAGGGAVEPVDE